MIQITPDIVLHVKRSDPFSNLISYQQLVVWQVCYQSAITLTLVRILHPG